MSQSAKIAMPKGSIVLTILVVLLGLVASNGYAVAQESAAVTLLKTAQGRKPTLQELYAMFFSYAVHVETRAIADEKLGIDRSFYQQHLQKASGLTTEDYAQVLAAAQRFA